jgi:hypothetical protein
LLNDQAPQLAAIADWRRLLWHLQCHHAFGGDRLHSMLRDSLMLASLALATASFITLGLSPSFAVNVIAFAGVGFGLAFFPACSTWRKRSSANRAADWGSWRSLPAHRAYWRPGPGWIATSQSTLPSACAP